MTRRRERAKAQHTMNKQLQPSYWQSAEAQKKEKDSSGNIYLKMSDVVFDLAKVEFGGTVIGGLFEDLSEPMLFYVLSGIAFTVLMTIGIALY